ncbi:MAG: hypothetical protein ACLR8Y_08900 [Alistipes indistinctus]
MTARYVRRRTLPPLRQPDSVYRRSYAGGGTATKSNPKDCAASCVISRRYRRRRDQPDRYRRGRQRLVGEAFAHGGSATKWIEAADKPLSTKLKETRHDLRPDRRFGLAFPAAGPQRGRARRRWY